MLELMGLFLGALLDAIVGINVIIPGVPFFLGAGYQLYFGSVWAVLAVLLGAALGEQLSYFLGRRLGGKLQRRLVCWQPRLRRPIARTKVLIRKQGNSIMVFARVLGPISWFMPFVAGTNQIPWSRFTLFSSLGLLLGAGQFIIFGYLAAAGVQAWTPFSIVLQFFDEHLLLLLSVALSISVLYIANRFDWKFKFLKVLALFLVCLVGSNYIHSSYNADANQASHPSTSANETIWDSGLKAFPGRSNVYNALAISLR